jgi:hypothetical protein
VLEPLARLPTTTVVTLPLGSTMLPVTFCAVLGPLLVKVTVAVMVLPGVPWPVTLTVVLTSANGFTGVTAVTVLFVVLLSGVVVATPAVQFCVVLEPAGTL